MKLPCEEAIWYILPRIRADIAKELIDSGLSQKEVSNKLGLTQSAISQYLHKKRGGKKKMPAGYNMMIKNASKILQETKSEDEVKKILCKCCKGACQKE